MRVLVNLIDFIIVLITIWILIGYTRTYFKLKEKIDKGIFGAKILGSIFVATGLSLLFEAILTGSVKSRTRFGSPPRILYGQDAINGAGYYLLWGTALLIIYFLLAKYLGEDL